MLLENICIYHRYHILVAPALLLNQQEGTTTAQSNTVPVVRQQTSPRNLYNTALSYLDST
jgi:hypothetical protein